MGEGEVGAAILEQRIANLLRWADSFGVEMIGTQPGKLLARAKSFLDKGNSRNAWDDFHTAVQVIERNDRIARVVVPDYKLVTERNPLGIRDIDGQLSLIIHQDYWGSNAYLHDDQLDHVIRHTFHEYSAARLIKRGIGRENYRFGIGIKAADVKIGFAPQSLLDKAIVDIKPRLR